MTKACSMTKNGATPIAAATTTGNMTKACSMTKNGATPIATATTTGNMAKARSMTTTGNMAKTRSMTSMAKTRSMISYMTTTGNLAKTLTTTSLRRYWMRSHRNTLATWTTRRLATLRTIQGRRRFVDPNAEQANQCSLRSRGTASSRDSSCPMNWT